MERAATSPSARRRLGTTVDPVAPDIRDRENELRTDHLTANIGQRSVRGGAVMFTAQAVKLLAQFGSVVVLVRLLPPAAFGLIAMTTALYAVLEPLRDFGLSAATIQNPDLTHSQTSTLFWVNAAAGTLLAGGLFAASPLIAEYYHQPQLVAVTRWIAAGFMLTGLSAQHWALLRRQMRFTAVATLETSAELISFAVAIGLAMAGAGYWALVAQRLVGPTLIAPGCWLLCRWRPSRPVFAPGAAALLRFGSSIAGTSMIAMFARSIDQVLIGWIWGPASLGFYDRATKLFVSPLTNILVPLYSIGMPALSRLTVDEDRYRRAFGEILEKLAMVTMPAAAVVVATADWTTEMLFGPKWAAAAPLVGWFALIIGYQPSVDTCPLLYMTQMRSGELLRASAIDAVLRIAAVGCTLPYGANAVAAALAISGLLVRAPVSFWLATRCGPVGHAQICRALLPSALAGCSVAAAIWILRRAALPADVSVVLGLVCALLIALVSAGSVFLVVPKSRRALFDILGVGKILFRAGYATPRAERAAGVVA
jgi:polysaccharide transporter, PST family